MGQRQKEVSVADLFSSATSSGLKLLRPLAFFDLETTGTNISRDRIVEISVLRLSPDGSKVSKTWRINPTIPIPDEASSVHGITDEDVATCPTFGEMAAEIFEFMNPCDFAGFNSNHFDIPVLLEEFLRVGINLKLEERAMIDVHKIYTHFEKRTLEAAYLFYCNKQLTNAHSAEADVNATFEVLQAQLQRYSELKNDISWLHAFSSSNEKWIDAAKRIIEQNGKPVFNFGKYKGRLVEEVLTQDPGYYSWMMNGDFALHTKQKLKEIRDRMKRG